MGETFNGGALIDKVLLVLKDFIVKALVFAKQRPDRAHSPRLRKACKIVKEGFLTPFCLSGFKRQW
jgi:hypothetical protein